MLQQSPLARMEPVPEPRSYRAFRTLTEMAAFVRKHQSKITTARRCPVSGRYIAHYKGIIKERKRSTTTRVIMTCGIMLGVPATLERGKIVVS
jgi:hypothetical protein